MRKLNELRPTRLSDCCFLNTCVCVCVCCCFIVSPIQLRNCLHFYCYLNICLSLFMFPKTWKYFPSCSFFCARKFGCFSIYRTTLKYAKTPTTARYALLKVFFSLIFFFCIPLDWKKNSFMEFNFILKFYFFFQHSLCPKDTVFYSVDAK